MNAPVGRAGRGPLHRAVRNDNDQLIAQCDGTPLDIIWLSGRHVPHHPVCDTCAAITAATP